MPPETPIQPFEVLFDHAEPSPFDDPAFTPYGNFGFPPAPQGRPWIYTNFVQSLDGITSLLGEYASGQYISQSREDRWLMDLLRANADGLIMGMATLRKKSGCAALRAGALSSRFSIPLCKICAPGSARGASATFSSPAPKIWICRSSRFSTETWSTRQSLPRPPAANASAHKASILKLPSSPPERENV